MIYPLPPDQEEQDFSHGGHFGYTPEVQKPFFTLKQMRTYAELNAKKNAPADKSQD